MNFGPFWWISYYLSDVRLLAIIIIASIGFSLLLEFAFWWAAFRAQGKTVKATFLFAWIGLVQIVSTSLSFALAILFFQTTTPTPILLEMEAMHLLFLVLNPITNSLGTLLSFFLVPFILESGMWSFSNKRYLQVVEGYSRAQGEPTSTPVLLGLCFGANGVSFLTGYLTLNPYLNEMWMSTGLLIFLFFIAGAILLFVWMGASWRRKLAPLEIRPPRRAILAALILVSILVLSVCSTIVIGAMVPLISWSEDTITSPRAVQDAHGNIHVIWRDRALQADQSILVGICHRTLTNGTWSPTEYISTPQHTEDLYNDLDRYMLSSVSLDADGDGRLMAGWLEFVETDEWGEFRTPYYRLFDGNSWLAISSPPADLENTIALSLVFGNTSQFHALWGEYEGIISGNHTFAVFHAMNNWTTGTWTTPDQLYQFSCSSDLFSATKIHTKLVFTTNHRIHAFFGVELDTTPSRVICHSYLVGDTWTSPQVVSNTNSSQWNNFGAVAGPSGCVHFVWQGRNTSTLTGLYYRQFNNSAWSPSTRINPGESSYELMMGGDADGNLHIAWNSAGGWLGSRKWYDGTLHPIEWYPSPPDLIRSEVQDLVMCNTSTSHAFGKHSYGWSGPPHYFGSSELVYYNLSGTTSTPGTLLTIPSPSYQSHLMMQLGQIALTLIIAATGLTPLMVYLTYHAFLFIFEPTPRIFSRYP